jgi:hypothetical protein
MPNVQITPAAPLLIRAIAIALAVSTSVIVGCSSGGTTRTNVYSWKPKAASQAGRASSTTRPLAVESNMAGEEVLAESHRAATATWVAVPSPDGKKMRWVQVK